MMDVSAETADLVVKESLQATESAAKLLGAASRMWPPSSLPSPRTIIRW